METNLRIKSFNKNYIPKLTAERLKNWMQPNRESILVDDEFALMSKDTFNQLQNEPEKYHWFRDAGKMCRYNDLFYWYGLHPKENMVSLHFRKIILLD